MGNYFWYPATKNHKDRTWFTVIDDIQLVFDSCEHRNAQYIAKLKYGTVRYILKAEIKNNEVIWEFQLNPNFPVPAIFMNRCTYGMTICTAEVIDILNSLCERESLLQNRDNLIARLQTLSACPDVENYEFYLDSKRIIF